MLPLGSANKIKSYLFKYILLYSRALKTCEDKGHVIYDG